MTGVDWSNKEEANKRRAETKLINHSKNKQKAIEYTGGLKCHNPECGWESELKLSQVDFHHMIKQNKTKNFSELFRSYKWERVKEEIDRCKAIPLCANCHRLEEFD